jgi:hypothetical protein
MREHTREQFEEVALASIDDAGCVPCDSIEEFKEGLELMIKLIQERISELAC